MINPSRWQGPIHGTFHAGIAATLDDLIHHTGGARKTGSSNHRGQEDQRLGGHVRASNIANSGCNQNHGHNSGLGKFFINRPTGKKPSNTIVGLSHRIGIGG